MNSVRALLLAIGLLACADHGDSMMGKSCTAIGCNDGITIDLGPRAAYGSSATLNVHVCIDSTCGDTVVTATATGTDCQLKGAGGPTTPPLLLMCQPVSNLVITASVTASFGSGSHLVAVSVSDASGTVVFTHSDTVGTTSTQPNGMGCEPVCHQGNVSMHP
jgi:hypothetical protein